MPIIKSAKKRVRTAAKANARNTRTRRDLREALKGFAKAIESGKAAGIVKAQNEAASAIDTAAKKNVIHKNKAARQKARLAKQARSAGVKPSKNTVKKAAVKPVAKKPAANPDVRKAKSGPRPKRRGKPATKK